jgi:hypothetical protein
MSGSKIVRGAPEFVYACHGLPRAARTYGAPPLAHRDRTTSGDVE